MKMSYSMSPAPNGLQQQRPYSPYQNATSPTNGPYGPPPAKRQRTSPDPRSPQTGTPTYAQHQGLPNVGAYGNPYPAQSPYGTPGGYVASPQTQSGFNTPQPYPYQQMPWQPQTHSQPPTPSSAGPYGPSQGSPPQQLSREMMPPPPRPNKDDRDDKGKVEDFGDIVFGSGIDLKEEENYLHNVYNNRNVGDSFSTNQNTSFESSTMSAGNSFNLLTQGTSFGSQDANGAFAGTMGQTLSQDAVELEVRKKREAAAKKQAEFRSQHLNNQFLLCNNVRKRMDRLALNQGVTVNMQGVFVRQPESKVSLSNGATGIVSNSDKVDGIKKPESMVTPGYPFETVVSLISLAAGERLRGLLDEAHAMSRARRYGDHGRVVPFDFADIAEGEGARTEETATPQNLTGTQWDKTSAASNPADAPVQRTISFQGTLTVHLRNLASAEKSAEEARIKKREARKRAAEANSTDDTAALPADAIANGIAEAAKVTKKELAKQAKEKANASEAQLHSTTNQTAAMMALGGKKKKYNWMTGGAAEMPTNRFAKPGPSGTVTPVAKVETGSGGPTTPGAGAVVGKEEVEKAVEWGDWRETESKAVEMRDWVAVLERDGKEKKGLERALLKLG